MLVYDQYYHHMQVHGTTRGTVFDATDGVRHTVPVHGDAGLHLHNITQSISFF